MEDSEEVVGLTGWCDLCNLTFGGSMTARRGIYFQGKFYHHECYPRVVNTYLATKRLKKATND